MNGKFSVRSRDDRVSLDFGNETEGKCITFAVDDDGGIDARDAVTILRTLAKELEIVLTAELTMKVETGEKTV
jgi:hypothetical protein